MKPLSEHNFRQERKSTLRITAQDFYGLYAPSDCALRVWLRARNEPEPEPGAYEQVLLRLGQRHEAAHLATFPNATDLRSLDFDQRAEKTRQLVTGGAAVLYQPVLKCFITVDGITCEVVGEPDFLIREGDDYVVRDVKLVRRVDDENHPEAVLQVAYYGWLFERVFGQPPARLEVLNGQSELVPVPQNVENVLRHLRHIVELKTLKTPPYSPVGWSKCTGCGFHDRCWKEAKARNDVAIVYGVDQGLAVALHNRGVQRIEELVGQFNATSLAGFQRPWGEKVQKVGRSAGAILRSAQALLTNTETALAPPTIPKCDKAVLLDLEGLPPTLDETSRIYLWGTQLCGEPQGDYEPSVAGFGQDGDRQGWHDFLRIAKNIFQQHGDIPWIHWANYERAQINQYICRYGDPNAVAARILDNLVDLLPITRNSIVLPLSSYSLKEVEKHIGFKRSQSQFGGSWSMAKFIEAVETQDESLRNRIMDEILRYNREDLAATWAVLDWLKNKRPAV